MTDLICPLRWYYLKWCHQHPWWYNWYKKLFDSFTTLKNILTSETEEIEGISRYQNNHLNISIKMLSSKVVTPVLMVVKIFTKNYLIFLAYFCYVTLNISVTSRARDDIKVPKLSSQCALLNSMV